jgi:hypothetical protein
MPEKLEQDRSMGGSWEAAFRFVGAGNSLNGKYRDKSRF